jgi:hypothetical protein
MKVVVRNVAFIMLMAGMVFISQGQSRTELCRGSGYHCMDVDYNGIKAKLVKGKNAPSAVIIDDDEAPKKAS